MSAQQFSRPGAVDLSTLGTPAAAGQAASPGGGGGPGTYSFDTTEQDFQTDVADPSMTHPVVLALWSSRAPDSKPAVELLSRVADDFEGRLSLARMDIDTNPQLAQALQVRAVPYVLAVLRGQPVPLFEGSVDEEQARQALDQVVQAAVSNGVTGLASPRGVEPEAGDEPAADEEPAADPRFAAGDTAMDEGDYAGAVAAYQRVVDTSPGDADAAARLAQAQLLRRTDGHELEAVRAEATERPDDLEAQLLAADVELLGGLVGDAFDRVIGIVPRVFGDDRERARQHLLGLFDALGGGDARVADARRRLANALF
ncbi:MAG: tetratricopeptide repeat protein [Nocardioidaceae bacterium]|nr:tetratricopeptide repeat protein [Nocardioidaceae bacterium]